MKCPQCKTRMKCLDTRWNAVTVQTRRRWSCKCGVRGATLEGWESAPLRKAPKKAKKINVEKATDTLMSAFYGAPKKAKPKTEKQVVVKHTPTKSMFEDADEDNQYSNYEDLGIDIPKGDDW